MTEGLALLVRPGGQSLALQPCRIVALSPFHMFAAHPTDALPSAVLAEVDRDLQTALLDGANSVAVTTTDLGMEA